MRGDPAANPNFSGGTPVHKSSAKAGVYVMLNNAMKQTEYEIRTPAVDRAKSFFTCGVVLVPDLNTNQAVAIKLISHVGNYIHDMYLGILDLS